MMCRRQRGFSLMYVMAAVPLIAMVASVSFQLVHRIMLVQTIELHRLDEDAKAAHLVRRLRRDAAGAHAATLTPAGPSTRLELASTEGGVAYTISGMHITRSVKGASSWSDADTWTFESMQVEFHIESVDAAPRLVWITFVTPSKNDRGAVRASKLSTVVTIGSGGRS